MRFLILLFLSVFVASLPTTRITFKVDKGAPPNIMVNDVLRNLRAKTTKELQRDDLSITIRQYLEDFRSAIDKYIMVNPDGPTIGEIWTLMTDGSYVGIIDAK
jgi:hypothetical protein